MIEYRQRVPHVQAMMVWDGTPDTANEIKKWTAAARARESGFAEKYGFLLPDEVNDMWSGAGQTAHAHLWVAHSEGWVAVPVGHRVVEELTGDGFYPLSPEGLAAGFMHEPVRCLCPGGESHPQATWREPRCRIHGNGPGAYANREYTSTST